jgi:transcriptional regulator with AAA-type ATPase domain/NAD-dependent dihydropyrimidine dehydrogenase PreA subunit
MDLNQRVIWLQERTALSILSEEMLRAIAAVMQPQTLPSQQTLLAENTLPTGLYLLQAGQLDSYRTQGGQSSHFLSFLPGSVLYLRELLLNRPSQEAVVAGAESQLWFIPADLFEQIAGQYPELTLALSRQLAAELATVSSQLTLEQERQAALLPYLVTMAKRGIVGKSRYALRLRQQIKEATGDRQSVLIFGEPGLEKDNIAALIHFGSASRRQRMIQLKSSALQPSGADLFGRASGKPGLIEWLGAGTLVLDDIQELPAELLPKIIHLLQTGEYTPVSRPSEAVALPRQSQARIIIIAEKAQSKFSVAIPHILKVPPLRVRKADIKAQVEYYIALTCRARHRPCAQLTPEALRSLQSYDFPGNLRELESLVRRAIAQSETPELTEELFWSVPSKKRHFRVNLFNAYPGLRRFLRSPWWPDRINYGLTLGLFALVVILLFVGPQHRDQNVALNLFWAWWWPLVLLGFPFVGRVWCAFCPFMIYGEVAQKLSLWLFPRKLKTWPRQQSEKWGGWFLFALFALIFLWEELWHLEDTAYLSSCLLLLITAGAVIFSLLFERRYWCRYLCPIGGMNGLFAKLSMTELRAQQGTCSAECTTYQCYKGGPQKGEGLETNGCPLYSHPAQLEDNRDCVLCMTCLKACPHRSVELNLRPPGIELWTSHVPHPSEVALLLLLLGGVFLHHLPEIQADWGLAFSLTQFWPHLAASVAVLAIAALLPLLAHGSLSLFQGTGKSRPFLELAYGYLPLVLGGNLAHYLQLGLGEAGKILPVTWATLGYGRANLPIWVAHPAVIAFLQATTLIATVVLSIVLAQKISRQSFWRMLPQHGMAIAIGVGFWSVIGPPG